MHCKTRQSHIASSECRMFNILLPLITLVLFGIYLFFHVSAQIQGSILESVFDNRTITEAITNLTTDLTPPYWNLYLWDLIHIWQATWLFFVFGVMFCYCRELIFPCWMFILFGLAIILSTIWTVTFTHLNIVGSFIVILLATVLLSTVFLMTCQFVEYTLVCQYPQWIIIGLRSFLLNGLGLFAAYIFGLFFISFDEMLVNGTSADSLISGVTLLAFYSAFVVVYFALDMTVLSKHLNFVWTPYISWIWILSGIIDHYNSDELSLNYAVPIIAIVLLAFVAITFFIKICFTFKRLSCGQAICDTIYESVSNLYQDSCLNQKQKVCKKRESCTPPQVVQKPKCQSTKVVLCPKEEKQCKPIIEKPQKSKPIIEKCDSPSSPSTTPITHPKSTQC